MTHYKDNINPLLDTSAGLRALHTEEARYQPRFCHHCGVTLAGCIEPTGAELQPGEYLTWISTRPEMPGAVSYRCYQCYQHLRTHVPGVPCSVCARRRIRGL